MGIPSFDGWFSFVSDWFVLVRYFSKLVVRFVIAFVRIEYH